MRESEKKITQKNQTRESDEGIRRENPTRESDERIIQMTHTRRNLTRGLDEIIRKESQNWIIELNKRIGQENQTK